ncbi:hypothetical protein PAL_GLEAN10014597 [Pteropus alecto]|uniref:Uncharacterized protein n=1 Tax=Pteropus alecto TaxID=9402 RepID=L5KNS1_PTEAL|nr:hypothetical protein PAL_GLEAN10014597 [Pteropus alecto]
MACQWPRGVPTMPRLRFVTSWVLTRIEGQLWVDPGRHEAQSHSSPGLICRRNINAARAHLSPGAVGSAGSRVSRGVSLKEQRETPGREAWVDSPASGSWAPGRPGQALAAAP